MRNANLTDLVALLKEEHSRKVDVVVPASSLRARGGQIVVKGAETVLDENGVTVVDGTYLPTDVFDETIAGALQIGSPYLKRCRQDATDLYDANINGWLHGRTIRRAGQDPEVLRQADSRSFLFRGFATHTRQDGTELPSVARALLSDRFSPVDNLDVILSALEGIRQAGVQAEVHSCSLSERKMYVRVAVPQLRAMAPELLKGYRNPFARQDVAEQRDHGWSRDGELTSAAEEGPVVFAGLDFRNSEVGGGAFTISPVVIVKVCSNGMVIEKETLRKVHLGSRMEHGRIDWGNDTKQKHLELVGLQTRDAVKMFLTQSFLDSQVAGLEEKAGTPIQHAEPTIKRLGKDLKFTEMEMSGILDHFTMGGQMTAGGVANAITSYSQTVPSADRAHELDDLAVRALALAAK